MNLKSPSSILRSMDKSFVIEVLVVAGLSFVIASCSKKPMEFYHEGIKSFTAGKFEEAQESFSEGIRRSLKEGSSLRNDSLYAGFIAANLVTGKYAPIISAYNDLSKRIHTTLAGMYGERTMKMLGIVKEIVPYDTSGGNRLPRDYPQTIAIQAIADNSGFSMIEQQVDEIVKK
jgi:hypothetical protein